MVGGKGGGGPAKRTVAPALGLRTREIAVEVESGAWVRHTEMPSASRLWGEVEVGDILERQVSMVKDCGDAFGRGVPF